MEVPSSVPKGSRWRTSVSNTWTTIFAPQPETSAKKQEPHLPNLMSRHLFPVIPTEALPRSANFKDLARIQEVLGESLTPRRNFIKLDLYLDDLEEGLDAGDDDLEDDKLSKITGQLSSSAASSVTADSDLGPRRSAWGAARFLDQTDMPDFASIRDELDGMEQVPRTSMVRFSEDLAEMRQFVVSGSWYSAEAEDTARRSALLLCLRKLFGCGSVIKPDEGEEPDKDKAAEEDSELKARIGEAARNTEYNLSVSKALRGKGVQSHALPKGATMPSVDDYVKWVYDQVEKERQDCEKHLKKLQARGKALDGSLLDVTTRPGWPNSLSESDQKTLESLKAQRLALAADIEKLKLRLGWGTNRWGEIDGG
eukprot:TRINITY_DN103978_c0_g1_i1.p1 TRINITY_DN103978_c0_g1~~TRINITY_DN103978_c0_g1_i1.p1  ORF type:complete len:368 (+),score=85.33 TRINITY_DN103978_c0_g1_i1:196-1299(+)